MGAVMAERLDLPEPIAAYFAADKRDIEAIAQCFTKDAVVKDEGHTYTGVMAIKQWKAETSTKYTYTSEPFALERHGGRGHGASQVAEGERSSSSTSSSRKAAGVLKWIPWMPIPAAASALTATSSI